jgi:hypothetical protein
MPRISKVPVERHDGKASLLPQYVIVVRVASFAFRFENVERLRECMRKAVIFIKQTRAT